MIRLDDPFTQQYSPIPMAFGSVFIYVGLGLLTYITGQKLTNWVWWSGVVILACGLILEFVTRRVAYIKMYQTLVSFALTLTFGVLLWIVAIIGKSTEVALLLTMILLASLFMTGIGTYKYAQDRRPNASSKPVGRVWESFNPKTGIITRGSSGQQVREQERYHKGHARLNRLGPLIAGSAMLVASSLGGSGINIAIAIVAFAITFGAAIGVGGALFNMIAVISWENEHGKPIIVKRKALS